MGADGGLVAKRSDMVKTNYNLNQDKPYKRDLNDRWTKCCLTNTSLEDPVVSDWNGNLYNRKSVLNYLLGEAPSNLKPLTEIKQIRDIVELKREIEDNQWIDPVTSKQLTTEGNSEQFGYIAECGHISPTKILKKMDSCTICAASYKFYTILNPTTIDAENHNQQRIAYLKELGLSHNLRPVKPEHVIRRKTVEPRSPRQSPNKKVKRS